MTLCWLGVHNKSVCMYTFKVNKKLTMRIFCCTDCGLVFGKKMAPDTEEVEE